MISNGIIESNHGPIKLTSAFLAAISSPGPIPSATQCAQLHRPLGTADNFGRMHFTWNTNVHESQHNKSPPFSHTSHTSLCSSDDFDFESFENEDEDEDDTREDDRCFPDDDDEEDDTSIAGASSVVSSSSSPFGFARDEDIPNALDTVTISS